VLILSGHSLTLDDVKRLEQHALVTLQSKGILSEVEAMATLHRTLFGNDVLPPHTSALVKRTIAYFHQHYDNTLTRQEIAEAVGVNKDYLGQIFRQELGISPWEYLNRYRIVHAKALLRNTKKSITAVAFLVGFNDPSYFGRVFRKQVGLSPRVYRKQAK
jgi:YesN/AraC family two-component response regulator